ncbi:HTH domain-containing protein [Flavobacterium sp. MR2016-29]|uniref:HTH domain-containing protein n=1 Tax=Flavobacterium sp. MR2016-29 TaxID=2783795 RepID=UPI00188D4A5E|nr:HTH domain-containing protein [Flavobacterium sp. MR2016-29]MBF4491045.1 HTH domain-containing protein [Flavobacterium sp. MR2016-29]
METLKVITAKELASSMGVSISTAKRYLKDIKEELACKIVLGEHVNKYFKIDAK